MMQCDHSDDWIDAVLNTSNSRKSNWNTLFKFCSLSLLTARLSGYLQNVSCLTAERHWKTMLSRHCGQSFSRQVGCWTLELSWLQRPIHHELRRFCIPPKASSRYTTKQRLIGAKKHPTYSSPSGWGPDGTVISILSILQPSWFCVMQAKLASLRRNKLWSLCRPPAPATF